MRTKPLYCLHYTWLSFKMLCKNGNSISVIQWVWDYPQNIKTERFGSQPEHSVFYGIGNSDRIPYSIKNIIALGAVVDGC